MKLLAPVSKVADKTTAAQSSRSNTASTSTTVVASSSSSAQSSSSSSSAQSSSSSSNGHDNHEVALSTKHIHTAGAQHDTLAIMIHEPALLPHYKHSDTATISTGTGLVSQAVKDLFKRQRWVMHGIDTDPILFDYLRQTPDLIKDRSKRQEVMELFQDVRTNTHDYEHFRSVAVGTIAIGGDFIDQEDLAQTLAVLEFNEPRVMLPLLAVICRQQGQYALAISLEGNFLLYLQSYLLPCIRGEIGDAVDRGEVIYQIVWLAQLLRDEFLLKMITNTLIDQLQDPRIEDELVPAEQKKLSQLRYTNDFRFDGKLKYTLFRAMGYLTSTIADPAYKKHVFDVLWRARLEKLKKAKDWLDVARCGGLDSNRNAMENVVSSMLPE